MKWKLIVAADGEPQIRERDGGPVPRRISLLAEMARDPGTGLSEVTPGVYLVRKELPVAGHDQDGPRGDGQQQQRRQ